VAHFRNHDRRGCERHAEARAARARAAGDLEAWGEALELKTRIQLTVGAEIVGRRLDDRDILDYLETAGEREPTLRARLTGALAEMHFAAFDFEAGLACSEAARKIAEQVGADDLTAVTAFTEGIQRLGRLQLREAEACFSTSVEHADRLPDGWLRTWGRGRLPLVLWAQGRFAEAWGAVSRALAVAEANHDWAEMSIVHAAATGLATAEGRFDVAEAHAASAVRTYARSEYAYTPGVLYPALSMARAFRADRVGTAEALADWRACGAVGLPRAFELFAAAAIGDLESTRALLGQCPWRGRPEQPIDLGALAFASGYVDVADLLDEPAVAAAVIPALEAARERGVRFMIVGGGSPLARLLATAYRLTGDTDHATTRLDEAEHHLQAAPSRLGEAQVKYERAVLAALAGDASQAASFAADAAALFDDVGAFAGLARAEAVRRRVSRGSVQPARRTRVILVTDLVGSTSLNVAVGDDRYIELLHEHDETIGALVRRYGGVPFNHTGDGLLAWFDRGDDAAACALAFQPALDDVNRTHSEHRLQVRCGLAAGEPIDDAGNIFGLAVVRASRVCAEGGAGDVLASSEVMALAPAARSTTFGPVHLKGLPEPVLIHSLRASDGQRVSR
jgi:class 3 adenylate cyclase/tetratricopeptide (TPR) repeat protein